MTPILTKALELMCFREIMFTKRFHYYIKFNNSAWPFYMFYVHNTGSDENVVLYWLLHGLDKTKAFRNGIKMLH